MTRPRRADWLDAEAATYTAEYITVDDLTVTVCLDDEGVFRPAYYWDITQDGTCEGGCLRCTRYSNLEPHPPRIWDGWASSPAQARNESWRTARSIIRFRGRTT